MRNYCHNDGSTTMTTEDVLIDELVQRVISSGVERLVSERTAGGSVVEKTAVVWPGCEEFTVEKGQQTIEKTVQGWQLSESWKHCIDYLGTCPDGRLGGEEREAGEGGGEGAGEGESGELHCYQVQWSEPTRLKPVPMATASVYFFIQRHKGPVQVCYMLEGQRLVHRPGSTSFQEVWLRNVIQQKLSVLDTNPQWSPIRTT